MAILAQVLWSQFWKGRTTGPKPLAVLDRFSAMEGATDENGLPVRDASGSSDRGERGEEGAATATAEERAEEKKDTDENDIFGGEPE